MVFTDCILCKSSATTPCPRCQKPLCPKHGTAVYDGETPVYVPDQYCLAPLTAQFPDLPFITCMVKGPEDA